MKPVSVRFKCFGPYMAEQYIDFRALEKNGLFLISGETGAGKTTILDAMCYALYGRSSGGLRGDMSVMRCKLAEKNDETAVEFIFDSDGKRYKFTRSLKYGRKNLNDSHNCLILEGEEYVPIFENPKATVVNKKAEELIGLTYDQFRQVIILPQGQFEKLLVSDSAEKEKILVSLFHADRWQRIADELYRRVAEQDADLRQEKIRITAKLAEYGCGNLTDMAQKRQEKQLGLDALRLSAETAQKQVAQQKALHDRSLLQSQAFQELHKRQRAFDALEKQADRYNAEGEILELADGAERIHPRFAEYQEAKRGKTRAENTLNQRKTTLVEAEAALNRVCRQKQAHDAGAEEQTRRKTDLTRLEQSREVYETLAEKRSAVTAAQVALRDAKAAAQQAEESFRSCDELWQTAVLKQDRAIQEYQSAQTLYLRGIGSVLAEQLTAGVPCPVCGSTSHPSPAQKAQGHVTDAQLEKLNKAMNKAGKDVTKTMKDRTGAEAAQRKAQDTANRAAQAAAVAEKDRENAEERKIPGIETSQQLERTIRALRTEIDTYDRTGETLTNALTNAEGSLKAARTGAEAAREELTAVQALYAARLAAWEEALTASGLETEERFLLADLEPREKQRRREALIRYRTDLSRAREALEEQNALLTGQAAPDMDAIAGELKAAEKNLREISDSLILEENSLHRLISDEKNLTKQLELHEARRARVDGDLDFANRLRGRSGVSLQRYVLGVMLTSITAEANRLLAKVYGGRYRLYRTDEIAGSARKGGLELEVFDSHNNQRRSVTTLSGGEKFLVALSLAIGLSTVVQAQGSGIRLEAMFIDEGFGSLDRDAVGDALEVLQGIQRSAGVVGIISHVEQLAETIPSRIEITKGKNGSSCRILG